MYSTFSEGHRLATGSGPYIAARESTGREEESTRVIGLVNVSALMLSEADRRRIGTGYPGYSHSFSPLSRFGRLGMNSAARIVTCLATSKARVCANVIIAR